RAKLGPEYESLIGTVRNVGYRFVSSEKGEKSAREKKAAADARAVTDAATRFAREAVDGPAVENGSYARDAEPLDGTARGGRTSNP
ncbi:MAG TPA: hypothetical protein VNS49_01035, partial [Streptomyces sp.]|nr:hypothetical protein [Streptomyces sp.]